MDKKQLRNLLVSFNWLLKDIKKITKWLLIIVIINLLLTILMMLLKGKYI